MNVYKIKEKDGGSPRHFPPVVASPLAMRSCRLNESIATNIIIFHYNIIVVLIRCIMYDIIVFPTTFTKYANVSYTGEQYCNNIALKFNNVRLCIIEKKID